MKSKLLRQTMFLSCSHFAVRAVGFVLRIWLSRALGPQAMGLVELTHSIQMLLVTPVVSGLPAAVSRLCAQASDDPARRARVLRCGMALALLTGIPMAIVAFFMREQLALWLGDIRTLPALLVYLPCIPVLGLSCALNGYFYGMGRPVPPALSETLEQIVRFLLCVRLVSLLQDEPLILRAAIPAAGALAGETAGLLLMLLLAARVVLGIRGSGSRRAILREMIALALPLTGMKLVSSLMRTVNATLIPARLQVSGLSSAEALSQLGMMQGMLMPLLMLPSFITCSLCMVSAPELTRRQAKGQPLASLCARVLTATLGVGLAAMAAVSLFAPFCAETLYRQPDLLPLLRHWCFLIPVLALAQVTGGLMNGLGLQSASLRISLLSNLVSVLITYFLAANPALQLSGALIAMGAAQTLTLVMTARVLLRAVRQPA